MGEWITSRSWFPSFIQPSPTHPLSQIHQAENEKMTLEEAEDEVRRALAARRKEVEVLTKEVAAFRRTASLTHLPSLAVEMRVRGGQQLWCLVRYTLPPSSEGEGGGGEVVEWRGEDEVLAWAETTHPPTPLRLPTLLQDAHLEDLNKTHLEHKQALETMNEELEKVRTHPPFLLSIYLNPFPSAQPTHTANRRL